MTVGDGGREKDEDGPTRTHTRTHTCDEVTTHPPPQMDRPARPPHATHTRTCPPAHPEQGRVECLPSLPFHVTDGCKPYLITIFIIRLVYSFYDVVP